MGNFVKAIGMVWKYRALLGAIKQIITLAKRAEALFQANQPAEKREFVCELAYDSLVQAEKASKREFVDEKKAKEAVGLLVDGTIKFFDAFGMWHN